MLWLIYFLGYAVSNLLSLAIWQSARGEAFEIVARNLNEFGPRYILISIVIYTAIFFAIYRRAKTEKLAEILWKLTWIGFPLILALILKSSSILDVLSLPILPLATLRDQIFYFQLGLIGISTGHALLFSLGETRFLLLEKLRPWVRYLIPTLIALIFSVGFIIWANVHHQTLDTYARDLSIFDQAVWHLSRFEAPASTIRGVTNLWADHFHPILIFFAPLFWIWRDVRVLLFTQIALVASGVFPIFLLAEKKLKSRWLATAFALVYCSYLPLERALAFGFYPENLVSPILAWLFYFLEEERIWPARILLVLLLMTKENASLYAIAIGAYFFFEKPHLQRWATQTMALGFIWFIVSVKIIIPSLLGAPYPYFTYSQLGSTTGEAGLRALLNPFQTWAIAVNNNLKINTLLLQSVPTLFLFLWRPFILVGLPMLGESFLSDRPAQWGSNFHYAAPMTTIVIVGSILGLEYLLATRLKELRITAASTLGVAMIFTGFVLNKQQASPLWLTLTNHLPNHVETKHATILDGLSHVPETGSITTQADLAPHLSERAVIYDDDGLFRDPKYYPFLGQTDYVVYARDISYYPHDAAYFRAKINQLQTNAGYSVWYANDWLIVLSKVAPTAPVILPSTWKEFLNPGTIS